jgi:hypothetical protein
LKLLLDEHISPVVASELRRLGHDVICVAEIPDLRGREDDALLSVAADADRVLVTADISTVPAIAETARIEGRHHPGIVLVSPGRFALRRRDPGPPIAALAGLIIASEVDALANSIIWLQAP